MSNRSIFFVGDIQGCAQELKLLLQHAEFEPSRHRLVPVGDTINRGPDSPGVLRLLREMEAEPLLGNHERGLQNLDLEHPPVWALQPASAFMQLDAAGEWQAALDWMREWPLVREGADWVAVHAGLHPFTSPQDLEPSYLTELRWCDEAGHRPPKEKGASLEGPPGYRPWYEHYRGDRTVIFGHWARRGLVNLPRLRGLDTGCVYGRQLTGLWWPEDRLVQVDALAAYARVKRPGAKST